MNYKYFVVTYESKNNIFKGKILVRGYSIEDAQNRFFDWLKKQEVYKHMWAIEAGFMELGVIEE